MKRFTGIAGIIGIFMFFMAALYAEKDSIQIKGSDTMVNLAQAWAEVFCKKNPGVNAAVTGGGSGTGIAALISGTADITISSRTVKGKEINKAFRGIVIARKHGNEIGATFTVRGEASGQIIEKIFPIHSPMVKKIEVIGESKTRRSKLYFIRELSPNKIRKKLKTKYTAKK